MKRIVQILVIVTVFFSLLSCAILRQEISNNETLHEDSKFKKNFSIGAIVEAHKEFLIEGPRALSGMEAGPREPFIQSQEYMTLQVNPDNAHFLFEVITSDVEEFLSASGATIVGHSGNDAQLDPIGHFSYSYSEGSTYGVINVWGISGEDKQLILISQITESKKVTEKQK